MARKIISYIAISLDGKIARLNGAVDWLDSIPNPDKLDYGYYDFYESIDATIQGGATYREVLGFEIEFPYKDKKNFVITHDGWKESDENVKFIHQDVDKFVTDLKANEGEDIWLIGGGQMNSLFLKNGWLDEMIVFLMPIVIGEGLPLFTPGIKDTHLSLIDTVNYPTGVVELRYKIV